MQMCRRTSMSSKKPVRHWKSWPMKCGSLRIMPGAFSRASQSVTRNSAASCLVLSSRLLASAICNAPSAQSQIKIIA